MSSHSDSSTLARHLSRSATFEHGLCQLRSCGDSLSRTAFCSRLFVSKATKKGILIGVYGFAIELMGL
jgi:hypothetical protein